MLKNKKVINILLIVLLFVISSIMLLLIILFIIKNIQQEDENIINQKYENAINSINSTSNINAYDCNQFKQLNISDYNICTIYLTDYKKQALYNIEEGYNLLDQEYKEKSFSEFESYKKYVNRNVAKIMKAYVNEYEVETYDDYKLYTVIDQNENYFIFKEKNVMDYTVILDTYTVPLPQFLEKYNSSNIQNKVALQVERIKEALNNQDYSFIYSKLADSFKNKNFPTEASFEEYVKSNFYTNNEFTYTKLETQDDNYMYTVTISNADDKTLASIEKTFVVNLKENADFVFSFSV